MRFANPFRQPGQWYKGSLHIHSTASDGQRTPEQVVAWYRGQGYHFLALTDHGVYRDGQRVADDFVTLSGIELEGVDPACGRYHLVGLGMQRPPGIGLRRDLALPEMVARLRTAGGRAVLAHPYWSGLMSKDLVGLTGCLALEVYNGGCEVDDAKGFSGVHWDDLLAAGDRLWGVAVDDAHWRSGTKDAGLGWVWVKAASLTQTAILDALDAGHFYASSGPEIHDLALEGDRVRVQCSPAVAIDFVGSGPYSRRVAAPPGQTLTEASYHLREGQRYVRVACQNGAGHWAWGNPIFLEPEGRR
ncbi:MAG: CehA/McbA family metallohydrolase [Anaerolineae bacterium]|jgi:hypothetical protein